MTSGKVQHKMRYMLASLEFGIIEHLIPCLFDRSKHLFNVDFLIDIRQFQGNSRLRGVVSGPY